MDDSGCVETLEHVNERRRWQRVLRHMVVAHHGRATRAVLEDTAFGRSRISHSSLDRVYFNFKPEALHTMQLAIHVSDVSLAVRRAGHEPLSDHVPVVTLIKPRRSVPPHLRLVPRRVTLLDNYGRLADAAAVRAVDISELHPNDRRKRVNQALRSAAAEARNEALRVAKKLPAARCQLAIQATRVATAGDAQLLRKVLTDWLELGDAVAIVGGQIVTRDLAKMRDSIGAEVARAAQPRDEASEAGGCRGRTRRRHVGTKSAATKRWVKQWAPHARRLWLGAALEEETPPGNAGANEADAADDANDTTTNVMRQKEY